MRPCDLRIPGVQGDGQGLRGEGLREINIQVLRLARCRQGQQGNGARVAVDQLGGSRSSSGRRRK